MACDVSPVAMFRFKILFERQETVQCSALVKIPYCGELGQRGSMPLTSTSSTASGLDFLSTFGVMFTKGFTKNA